MKQRKTVYAEAAIYYYADDGTARVQFRRGPHRTSAKNTKTAIPAYAKKVYKHTPAPIMDRIVSARFLLLDPCDPCDRWILESDGSEEAARILAQCDEENTAAGRTIPRASFLPPAT